MKAEIMKSWAVINNRGDFFYFHRSVELDRPLFGREEECAQRFDIRDQAVATALEMALANGDAFGELDVAEVRG